MSVPLADMKSHSSLLLTDDVQQICQPLVEHFNISYFTYVRLYPDMSRICLTSNGPWHEHFCHTKDYIEDIFTMANANPKPGLYLWRMLEDKPVFRDAEANFNLILGTTVVKKQSNYCEFYDFGSNKADRLSAEIYLACAQELHLFTHYFQDQSKQLIERSDLMHPPAHLVERHAAWQKEATHQQQALSKVKSSFRRQIRVKRYYLGKQFDDVYFTLQEFECARHLLQGESAQRVAEQMNITKRTAEEYIDNIKRKLDCRKTTELVHKLNETNLIHCLVPDSA